MNAIEVMRDVITNEQLTPSEASRKMEHKPSYLGTIFSSEKRGQKAIKTDTLAQFCEALDYELVVRSKSDGAEFVIDE